MKVQSVMVREVVSIRPDISARMALEFLFQHQISGLPVIDETEKLVGMFTEKDVLSFVLPSYIEKVGRFIYQDDPKSTKKKFIELDTVKVQQIMRKDVVTTTEDTSLCEVARIMLTQKARRLPVLNKDGKVIGIIARCDVVKALAAGPEASE